MGLDMWMVKKVYIGNRDKEDEDKVRIVVDHPDVDQDSILEIVEEVAYWRKANHIHNWFVKNVQGGEDDRGEYYVATSQLKELLDICEKVLEASELVEGKVYVGSKYKDGKTIEMYEGGQVIKDPTVAKKLLPTAEGFFFGSTRYDEFYFRDVERTVRYLKTILSKGGDYYYQSSW